MMLNQEFSIFVLMITMFFGGIYFSPVEEIDRVNKIDILENQRTIYNGTNWEDWEILPYGDGTNWEDWEILPYGEETFDESIILDEFFNGIINHDGDPETNYYELKLDATNSVDLDGDEIKYIWTQTSGDTLEIPNPNDKILYLKVSPGEYEFQLEAMDSYGSRGTFNKRVVVSEEPNSQPDPIVEFGSRLDEKKFIGTIIHDGNPETNKYNLKLDAGGSNDEESDKIEYAWTQISGNKLDMSNNKSQVVYLQAEAGEYSFKLDVTDSYGTTSSYTQAVAIDTEPNSPPEATFSISNEAKPILYKNGPTWQNVPDSVVAFQTKYRLTVDGTWGPASQKRFLKIASDKKAVNDKAAKAARDKVAKAARDEAKAKEMKIYTDKLAKIEAEIQEAQKLRGGRKKRTTLAELEAKKTAHIKTKPK